MRKIDLSMTIKNHWRWKVEQTLHHDFEKGDEFQTSIFTMGAHAFTHVDTPLHCKPGSITIEQLEVDAYSGTACVIDISDIKPNERIDLRRLQERAPEFRPDDIILIKTCWDEQYAPDSKEYWTEAPYVSDEAAIWLREQRPKAVGFDFPQDYPLKRIGSQQLKLSELTTHKQLLDYGIYHIEYLCNMKQITKSRVELIALPIKLEGFEGAPARVVAIENED